MHTNVYKIYQIVMKIVIIFNGTEIRAAIPGTAADFLQEYGILSLSCGDFIQDISY